MKTGSILCFQLPFFSCAKHSQIFKSFFFQFLLLISQTPSLVVHIPLGMMLTYMYIAVKYNVRVSALSCVRFPLLSLPV